MKSIPYFDPARELHIEIDYDPQKVIENKKRWDAAFDLSLADRPPVVWGAALRLILFMQGLNFDIFFNHPVDQLICLVKNWKWMAENLPGDMITELKIILQPQFENVSNPNRFGSSVRWDPYQPPTALPVIHTVDQLKNYQTPDFENTLWHRMIDYYHIMREYLDSGRLKVTLRGQPVEIDLQLHTGGESPFCIATDLCGTNIYEWLVSQPDSIHRLLGIITDELIKTEKKMREICGFPKTGKWFHTDDTAQIISLDHFREFVVPYTNRIYNELTGGKNERIMHLCGRHIHLYPALIDDLKIDGLWGYGYANKPEEVREGIGGKIWLLGNLDPLLLSQGKKEEIINETGKLLDNLLPCGGIIIADGYNLVPDTPMENLQTVVDTVTQYCS